MLKRDRAGRVEMVALLCALALATLVGCGGRATGKARATPTPTLYPLIQTPTAIATTSATPGVQQLPIPIASVSTILSPAPNGKYVATNTGERLGQRMCLAP